MVDVVPAGRDSSCHELLGRDAALPPNMLHSTLIIGARNEEQLRQNLGAVGWNLTPDQIKRLDTASAVTPAYPYWHQRASFSDRNPPAV